jgi:hypothetical protein
MRRKFLKSGEKEALDAAQVLWPKYSGGESPEIMTYSECRKAVAIGRCIIHPSLDTPLSPSHTDSVISVSVTTDSQSPVLLVLEVNVWSELAVGRPIRHRLARELARSH